MFEVNKKVLIVEDQFVEANDLQLMLKKAGYTVCGIARSVTNARELIKKENPGLVLLDIFLKGKETGIDLAKELKVHGIAFIYLSANSNETVLNEAKKTQPYGFLVKPFREKDLLVMLEIASYRHEQFLTSGDDKLEELFAAFASIAGSNQGYKEKLLQICQCLQQYIPFDYMTAGFNTIDHDATKALSFLRVGFDEYQEIDVQGFSTISHSRLEDLVSCLRNGTLHGKISETFNMQSCTSLPVLMKGEKFTFSFYSRKAATYDNCSESLYNRIQKSLSQELDAILGGRSSNDVKPARQNDSAFPGIIGKNTLLLAVFDAVKKVAPFDTSVLLLGESGTGKESVASNIHAFSRRKNKPFVKLNCASIPPTLIESELFGHEKGSFTGASDKRTGKFELANGGTIFLDEIGEMPLDMQVKLLRVLQEKEIEPVGGTHPVKINVRIIAASNRNLEKEVGEGRFRLDLYYRLNVFPIQLPALRERIDDIPLLVRHFLDVFNRKAGKNISGVSVNALEKMMAYEWPGNIRELENLMERCVLINDGNIIDELPISGYPSTVVPVNNEAEVKTIDEIEKDHILVVLKKCNGKIWGPGGAAEILKIPPTTLKSKMEKLGIRKDQA